jgi:hypothetical protein
MAPVRLRVVMVGAQLRYRLAGVLPYLTTDTRLRRPGGRTSATDRRDSARGMSSGARRRPGNAARDGRSSRVFTPASAFRTP